jgi:hypothetical protein
MQKHATHIVLLLITTVMISVAAQESKAEAAGPPRMGRPREAPRP